MKFVFMAPAMTRATCFHLNQNYPALNLMAAIRTEVLQ